MLIGGLVTHKLILSSVVGVRGLTDGSQSAVWPLVLEDVHVDQHYLKWVL